MCFMYMYIDFASFYDISIIFWTCSDNMVFITLVFRFDLHVRLLIISLIFPLNIPFVFLPT